MPNDITPPRSRRPSKEVRLLWLLDKLRRRFPVLRRPIDRFGAWMLDRVIRRERRRQGIVIGGRR
jgi:hypothetical protein